MKNLVYECNLEWLKAFVEGRASNSLSRPRPVKWQKLEDVAVVEMDAQIRKRISETKAANIVYRMLVWIGGAYKGWIEVRPSCVRDSYGLFAVARFEKGSIITAKIPIENQLDDSVLPSEDTLHLGWKWAVEKNADALGPTANAVYLRENGLVRASTRIMPGTEILLDGGCTSSRNGFEWLDSLVFAEPQKGWKNWHARGSIGKVVSGNSGHGFVVKFDHGTETLENVTEEELKKRSVVQNRLAEDVGVRGCLTCAETDQQAVAGNNSKVSDVCGKKRKVKGAEIAMSKRTEIHSGKE